VTNLSVCRGLYDRGVKVFHCDHCGQLVFFENVACVTCGRRLAWLPELSLVGSLDEAGDGVWRSPLPAAQGRTWRLCRNYTEESVCNWAVAADAEQPLCEACRLTTVIPDLSAPGRREAWYRLEAAKRRLIYTLLALGLPVRNRIDDPAEGLAFEFKADPEPSEAAPVLTGHANGVITINIAEADDAERERRKRALHEPYRTLLGHVRHESGHYYWDRLIAGSPRLEAFRAAFGDERADYRQALQSHYDRGPAPDWPQRFISAYASVHPWEDWAETWAHYLHMVDTLDTATACGLSLRPLRRDEPSLPRLATETVLVPDTPFDRLIDAWFPLTYVLNNLNRGMGLADGYPFVLPQPAIDKLRFVHDAIADRAAG
jgi:hypothetical protein